MKQIHTEILPSKSYLLLQKIQTIPEYKDFYLAGGTALALQIGHRMSYDFDFFTPFEFKSTLIKCVDDPYEVIGLHNNSIEIIKDETKIMWMYFGFPLLNKVVKIDNIRLASPVDIGLMKLLALQGRSSRKDIIDLYFIDKEIVKLTDLLEIFERHYPKESFNSYKSLKTLIDPSIFYKEPMPRMLKEVEWEVALSTVEKSIAKHLQAVLLKK